MFMLSLTPTDGIELGLEMNRGSRTGSQTPCLHTKVTGGAIHLSTQKADREGYSPNTTFAPRHYN